MLFVIDGIAAGSRQRFVGVVAAAPPVPVVAAVAVASAFPL